MQCLVPNMMSWWIRSWIGRLVDVERNVDHSSGSVDGWIDGVPCVRTRVSIARRWVSERAEDCKGSTYDEGVFLVEQEDDGQEVEIDLDLSDGRRRRRDRLW